MLDRQSSDPDLLREWIGVNAIEPILLSVPDAAVLLDVCEQTIWKRVYERRIGSVK